MKFVRSIHMGRAMGKTTKALQLLEAKGGGVFVTSNPIEAVNAVKRLGLKKVTVLSVEMAIGSQIVIDDADAFEVTLTSTAPLELVDI